MKAEQVKELLPEMRSKSLFDYFGWAGGTIHQISEITGVDSTILLYEEPNINILDTAFGFHAKTELDLEQRLKNVEKYYGNISYWLGVATAPS